MNMKRILVIAIGIFLFILILIGITFLESLKNKETDTGTGQPTPPTTAGSGRKINAPPVEYDKESTDKLLAVVTARPTPSPTSDKALRNQLISELDGNSGIINSTNSYRLEYVKAPNDFEAEIITTQISKAKEDVISFLRQKGFSDEGICKLPLMFYLNFEIAKSVPDDEKFSPYPDFCP